MFFEMTSIFRIDFNKSYYTSWVFTLLNCKGKYCSFEHILKKYQFSKKKKKGGFPKGVHMALSHSLLRFLEGYKAKFHIVKLSKKYIWNCLLGKKVSKCAFQKTNGENYNFIRPHYNAENYITKVLSMSRFENHWNKDGWNYRFKSYVYSSFR